MAGQCWTKWASRVCSRPSWGSYAWSWRLEYTWMNGIRSTPFTLQNRHEAEVSAGAPIVKHSTLVCYSETSMHEGGGSRPEKTTLFAECITVSHQPSLGYMKDFFTALKLYYYTGYQINSSILLLKLLLIIRIKHTSNITVEPLRVQLLVTQTFITYLGTKLGRSPEALSLGRCH